MYVFVCACVKSHYFGYVAVRRYFISSLCQNGDRLNKKMWLFIVREGAGVRVWRQSHKTGSWAKPRDVQLAYCTDWGQCCPWFDHYYALVFKEIISHCIKFWINECISSQYWSHPPHYVLFILQVPRGNLHHCCIRQHRKVRDFPSIVAHTICDQQQPLWPWWWQTHSLAWKTWRPFSGDLPLPWLMPWTSSPFALTKKNYRKEVEVHWRGTLCLCHPSPPYCHLLPLHPLPSTLHLPHPRLPSSMGTKSGLSLTCSPSPHWATLVSWDGQCRMKSKVMTLKCQNATLLFKYFWAQFLII